MPDDFTNFESKVKMYSLSNENTLRSGLTSCVRFAPGVLPEACGSDTGVSPDHVQETSQTDPFKVKENGAVLMDDETRKKVLTEWQNKKKEVLTHPYLKEKIEWGLVPYVQAMLLARYLRRDLDGYPVFLWK